MRLGWLSLAGLVAVTLVPGCAAPGSSGSPGGSSALRRELDRRSGDPAAVIAFVEANRGQIRDGRLLAELELAAARAFAAQSRTGTARTHFERAWSAVAPSAAGLGAEIQLAWASFEFAGGNSQAARARWDALLARPALSSRDGQSALACLVAACEAAGDATRANAYRKRLGAAASSAVADARRQLGLSSRLATTAKAPAPRGLPAGDPRALLAEIHPRSEWSARALKGNHDRMEPIRAITVHHSAMDRPAPGQAPSMLRLIQSQHQDGEGWADIGYHFLIDPQGLIWEGRPLSVQGAHAGDSLANRGNVGVCLLGNFDQQQVPQAQRAALERLLDTLRSRFALARSVVTPHSHWKSTACPGRHLAPIVSAYRGA